MSECNVPSFATSASSTSSYRVMYRLLARELEPCKVGLVPPPWLSCVRVVSLVIGEWTVDNRRRADRLNDPRLVEVGWTDALFPSFFDRLTGSATVHLKLISTAKMVNPGSKVTCCTARHLARSP